MRAWLRHPRVALAARLVLGLVFVAAALPKLAGALLLSFCLALGFNLARRHPVDCGCFGASAPKTEAERLADMRWLLLRDAGLLLLVAQLLTATRTNQTASRHRGKEKGTGK